MSDTLTSLDTVEISSKIANDPTYLQQLLQDREYINNLPIEEQAALDKLMDPAIPVKRLLANEPSSPVPEDWYSAGN